MLKQQYDKNNDNMHQQQHPEKKQTEETNTVHGNNDIKEIKNVCCLVVEERKKVCQKRKLESKMRTEPFQNLAEKFLGICKTV